MPVLYVDDQEVETSVEKCIDRGVAARNEVFASGNSSNLYES